MTASISSTTKAITKQFMNPARKYMSKERNKTFIEPKTPSENTAGLIKNKVYESGSTSRSGGTGEPNYSDGKNRFNYQKVNNSMYETKIAGLTKDNSTLKTEISKLKKDMEAMEKSMESNKKVLNDQNVKIKRLESLVLQKDNKITKMQKDFEQEREAESKIVNEYINAENYLLELVDEFTNGMRKIYANDIEFKDVDIEGLPFCERFSNLLYNILLIIDFQKQFIVEQSSGNNQNMYMNNECIIEEADNETDTENDNQNSVKRHTEQHSESDDEVIMRSDGKGILKESNKEFNFSDKNYESNDINRHSLPQSQAFTLNEYGHHYDSRDKKYYHDLDDNDIAKMDLPDFNEENEIGSELDEDQNEEPVINKTLVMLQKELHKSLFSPSLMKINESPKVSLLTDRSKNTSKNRSGSNIDPATYDNSTPGLTAGDIRSNPNPFMPANFNIPNIFGMNIRPSSGEVISPTSESSAHSLRKDRLSKDNRYQLQDNDSDANSDMMSLESIVIKKEGTTKFRNSQDDSVEEAFTPNFITKRSSLGGAYQMQNEAANQYYKEGRNVIPYDYRPPLATGIDSDSNAFRDEEDFSESFEGSEQNFSSNREDLEELKVDLTFPITSPKNN